MLLLVEYYDLDETPAREAAATIASCLRTMASSIERGEFNGYVNGQQNQHLCYWVIQDDVTFDEVRQAVGMEQPRH